MIPSDRFEDWARRTAARLKSHGWDYRSYQPYIGGEPMIEFTKVEVMNLQRMLETWTLLTTMEKNLVDWSIYIDETRRMVGTGLVGEEFLLFTDPAEVSRQSSLQMLRDGLAHGMTQLLETAKTRTTKQSVEPLKTNYDEELSRQFQNLKDASRTDRDNIIFNKCSVPLYDEDQWTKFQQLLYQRGIRV